MAKDRQQIIEEFDEAVNMTRKELEDWLRTEESQSVGQTDGGGESKGHESGRICKLSESLAYVCGIQRVGSASRTASAF